MRQVIRGILLGVSVFASINLFFLLTQRIAYYLDQINLMGILLTVGLLISGFVTGRFIGKKGFRYGVITGIFNYLFLCLVILLFAFYEYLGSGAR